MPLGKRQPQDPRRRAPASFELILPYEDWFVADHDEAFRPNVTSAEWRKMGVLVFILLTVAVFALLGLTQKLVERL